MRSRIALALLAMQLASCGGRNDYVGALVTAGLAVSMVAANRAMTGQCWGQCLNGLVCDSRSGMCVEPPEYTGNYQLPPRTDPDPEPEESAIAVGPTADASAPDGAAK